MQRGLVLLALVLALPSALGHAAFDRGAALPGGGSAHVEVTGAPLVAAGVPLEARVRTDAEGAPRLRLHAPSGEARGWVDASAPVPLLLDGPGAWRIEVAAGDASVTFEVDAWPAAAAFVQPSGAAAERGVLVEGARDVVALRLADAEGRALPLPADAVARVRGPAGARDVPLGPDGAVDVAWARGDWTVEALAPSLGLVEGVRPPLRLHVAGPEEASVYGLEARETPFPLWGVVVALALAGLTRGRPSSRSCTR